MKSNIDYTYDNYRVDLSKIQLYLSQKFERTEDISLYAVYSGALPLGVNLSKMLGCKLGIIDFQRYDGDSKTPKVIKDIGNMNVVIVDDIFDRGVTMQSCEALFPGAELITIFKHKTSPELPGCEKLFYCRENDTWIDFWWEK